MKNVLDNLTILVNSCDAYSDLWGAFFKLFKKYGGELTKCKIVLNTDKMQYSYPGLDIECPNHYQTIEPWGKRVKNCLKQIKTDYVFWLLDDFFIQRPCDVETIKQCLIWLNENKNIGAFNLLSLKQSDNESTKYKKFCFIKPDKEYRFNSQACVWNKNILYKSMLDIESPWDWEIYGNFRNAKLLRNIEMYCISELYDEPYFYNSEFDNKKYSPPAVRNAVIRGKWDLSCIEQCFKENGIQIDYTLRGIYQNNITPPPSNKFTRLKHKLYNLLHLKKYIKNKIEFKKKYKQLVSNAIKEYKKTQN